MAVPHSGQIFFDARRSYPHTRQQPGFTFFAPVAMPEDGGEGERKPKRGNESALGIEPKLTEENRWFDSDGKPARHGKHIGGVPTDDEVASTHAEQR